MGNCGSGTGGQKNEARASNVRGRKRSLLVGIVYRNTPVQLRGCINDATMMGKFLEQQGWPTGPNHMRVLTEDEETHNHPTSAHIINGLKWLVQDARSGDSLFFGFSGHGHQVADKDGDEEDGKDEALIPLDYKKSGFITDDTLFDLLAKKLPKGVRLTVMMDCCHSGTVLDLAWTFTATRENLDSSGPKPTGPSFKSHVGKGKSASGPPAKPPPDRAGGTARARMRADSTMSVSHGKVKKRPGPGMAIVISSSMDDQVSADLANVRTAFDTTADFSGEGAGGACLHAMISQLAESGPYQSYFTLMKGMSNKLKQKGFKQVPQLSASREIDLHKRVSLSPDESPLLELPLAPPSPMSSVNPLLLMLLLGTVNSPSDGDGGSQDGSRSDDESRNSYSEDSTSRYEEGAGYDDSTVNRTWSSHTSGSRSRSRTPTYSGSDRSYTDPAYDSDIDLRF